MRHSRYVLPYITIVLSTAALFLSIGHRAICRDAKKEPVESVEMEKIIVDTVILPSKTSQDLQIGTLQDESVNCPTESVESPAEESEVLWADLGNYRVTYYYLSEECCGKWAKYNKTFTGTTPTSGRTVAVDPNVIPLGAHLKINGIEYTAEDTGGFKGQLIDVFVDSKDEAYANVRKNGDYAHVYMEDKDD